MPDPQSANGLTRRDALKRGLATSTVLVGSLTVGGAALSTRTAAHPKPENHDVVWGDDVGYLDGVVQTYATTNPQGALSSLGVYVDADALAAFDDDALGVHLGLPSSVDTHQFTFVGFHYNPEGHPPPDVYTVPHYDFHFYVVPEEMVEGILGGPATFDLPDAQTPTDYQRLPVIDSDGDGERDTPLVEPHMGEHLADTTGAEFQPDGSFTHTNIYGAYDPDGDGTGQLTFVEPMVTTEFIDGLDEERVVEMKTPDVYAVADEYPTAYVMQPTMRGGVFVSIEEFAEFDGAGE
ncbi:hypothetical protein EGH21_10465 [Halomicroarcula sp. F13]|uniref:DUF5602 domain-containing protein n=1 Tax=Haloarcula rubra TaxID=2487747 RepID=A0AAW4PQJ1_9EURY|nr:hypothetical protein [Halomicroarcula rubra]MBX0323451.1 hypothetical protein [Halomicroarcula rubra]